MNLPPKIIRQQITWKRAGTEKVPLSAARPIINTTPDIPPPPQGLNSRLTPSSANASTIPPSNTIQAAEVQNIPVESPVLSSTTTAASEVKASFIPPTQITALSGTELRDERPAKTTSTGIEKPLGNLPVLSAFQDFLENERDRMRKQLIVMSVSYLFILIIVVAVSLSGGIIMLKSLRKDFQNMETEVNKLQALSMKAKTDAETLSERLSKETIKIRTEMGSSSEETSGKLKARVITYDDKLARMEKQVQLLTSENLLLKENLTSLQAGWLGFTNQMFSSVGKIEIGRIQQQKGSNLTDNTQERISTMVMSMKPVGIDRSMEWRIPIPE